MRIALYKRIGMSFSFEVVSTDGLESARDYVRISEFVDVDFPPLSAEETVGKQLAAIDAAEHELRDKFNSALASLSTERANLRALTHQVPA